MRLKKPLASSRAAVVLRSGLEPQCTAIHRHKHKLSLKVSKASIERLCERLRSQSGNGPVPKSG